MPNPTTANSLVRCEHDGALSGASLRMRIVCAACGTVTSELGESAYEPRPMLENA